MKDRLFDRKTLFSLLFIGMCLGFTATGYGQAVISVSPVIIESPAVGEQFTIRIDITGGRNVTAYQVTVNFDPTALRYVSSANADYLPAGAFTVPAQVTNNSVTITATAIGATALNANGTLATATFEVIAVKASAIELTGIRIVDPAANVLAFTTEDGMVIAPTPLQESSIADIVLIIDSSGSMEWNDPNDLRKAAARFFIDLVVPPLQNVIQIAIVDFNGFAKTLAPLTFANSAGKAELKRAVDRVDSDGDTDMALGLQLGFNALSASGTPDARKAAVLLTDGNDTTPKLASDYVRNYVAQGWTVYTIGFGNEVDRALLTQMAELTPEGAYFPASLDNMQTVYNKISALITKKSIISNHIGYINQHQQITKKFLIDASITQMVPSANWQGSTIALILIDPNGVEVTPLDAITNSGITYETAPTFAIYTIENPVPGEWGMKATGTDIPAEGEQYQLTVAATSDFVTNLLGFEPSYTVGDTVRIGIRAQSKTGQISEPVLGATASAEVVRPDGRIDSLNLTDVAGNGLYLNNYTGVDIEGTYLIRVSIQNGFSREIQEQIVVGNISNIFIDGSTLIPAAGETLDLSPGVVSAVISGPAGGINRDSIVLRIDGTPVSHGYDAVNQTVLFRPSGLSAGVHTVQLNVNNDLETTWTFTLALPESHFELQLDPGLNVVSLPLMPREPYTAKSFSELLDSTIVVKYDSTLQTYVAYVAVEDTDEGFAIEGGRGYIVNTPTPTAINFIGTAWSNQPGTPIIQLAPSLSTQTDAWAFVVNSDVHQMVPGTSYTVAAKNLRTGTLVTENISTTRRTATAVWANLNRESVIHAGDILEITLYDAQGAIVSGPFQREVSTTDIHNAYMTVQLTVGDARPKDTILSQNYPNPFNPETWIPYQLSKPAEVSIEIYDSVGHLVRTLDMGLKPTGIYMTRSRAAYWDGRNDRGERVASGIYFYTLQTPEFTATRRMVILK